MVNCGGCGKFLPLTGGAACSLCPLKFHKACLNLPDRAQISRDWACPNCKKNNRRGDNSQTPVKGICGSPPKDDQSNTPFDVAESSDTVKGGENRLYLQFTTFMAEMREFRKEMNELHVTLSSRMDCIEERLDALESREPDTGKRTAELERTVEELKRELNDWDQEVLLSDLEIGQLPEEKGVSVVQSVTVMAAGLGVTLEPRDVVFAERVGAPRAEAGERPRRVVVRLTRRQLRDELLKAARVRRGIVAPVGESATSAPPPVRRRVYLNERLTRHNRQLFHRVREECKVLQWWYSWTNRSRIFVRRTDGAQAYLIRTEPDMERVLGDRQK